MSYTNHTLLPEALESWPVPLLARMLPRHLEIIYRINEQHLRFAREKIRRSPDMLTPVSLIDERGSQRVRMGHLAFVGSHRINGVSALHTELMRQTTFRQLHELYADRIVNKTNGITFRRWLMQANPGLTKLLCEVCGAAVLDDQTTMVRLADHANDASLQERFRAVKRANKVALSRLIYERLELRIDPHALFDVQIKRIHEYKRQLLNLLETIALYTEMRSEPNRSWVPRVKIFAGKAAASYTQAKLIIKLANDVATVVNNDPAVRDFLKVVFIPNYNVSLAESIIPAAELSEQISTAGMEASGTGNMKLALNGALTIGTLDGANIEIRDHVGADNIFIFGLKAHEVEERRRSALDATETIAASPLLAEAVRGLESGLFANGDRGRFTPLTNALRHHDYYMIAADFDAYYGAQRRIDRLCQSASAWVRMSMLNIANMAWFSSDRTISEYARDIWNVPIEGRS
jgi:starch phosphorylase